MEKKSKVGAKKMIRKKKKKLNRYNRNNNIFIFVYITLIYSKFIQNDHLLTILLSFHKN